MKDCEILRCTPEEAGVPSGAVVEFCERLKGKGIPMHSIILARYGRVFAEGYYAPWDNTKKHRMFSETKSFTSLAIGCLVREGKLSLDDTIIRYFPEYAPQNPHPFLKEMTIRQMLMMETCYATTTYKADLKKNWVESFFITEPDHRAGTIFNYDTSASHTLCALVEKLTGIKLLDYLREQCLDKIGFSKDAYVVEDPFGVSMGGSGLMAYPMDMLRVGLLLMNQGEWNQEQLLPREYLEEATRFQVPTIAKAPILEEAQGYGYQFWRVSRGGYMMYGMGGQLLICLPRYQIICVTTADTMRISGGNQAIYESLYETILAAIEGRRNYIDYSENEYLQYMSHLHLEAVSGNSSPKDSSLLENINGVSYQITNGNALIQTVRFDLKEDTDEGVLTFSGEKGEYQLEFGVRKNKVCNFPVYDEPCASSAAWIAENTLYLNVEMMGENIGGFWLQAAFGENDITLFMNRTIEYCTGELSGFFRGVKAKK